MRHQLTLYVLQTREYAQHSVIYGVCRPVANIRHIRFLNRAKDLVDKILLHSRHLTKQEHFLSVLDPHIRVRVGGRAVQNYERNQVSQANKRSGRDECALRLSMY